MIEAQVIIVGGGPAGSTCSWHLKQNGIPSLILDKKSFPRHKLCAGWITPKAIKDLQIDIGEYPHQLLTYKRLNCYFFGRRIPVKTRQYSIRRYEFDDWLIKRANLSVTHHQVVNIRQEGNVYIIDDQFRCKYLVGAGGTGCRVYKTFFQQSNPRTKKRLITSMEEEFDYDYQDKECHLWFRENKLGGYAWYLPKGKGLLNVGIGGKFMGLKNRGETIRHHWNLLTEKLADLGLVKPRSFKPKGHNYYLRSKLTTVQLNNAFIIGDAAGLATIDMGEGIGPAVQSGLLAANSIITGKKYSIASIGRFSAVDVLLPWWKTLF